MYLVLPGHHHSVTRRTVLFRRHANAKVHACPALCSCKGSVGTLAGCAAVVTVTVAAATGARGTGGRSLPAMLASYLCGLTQTEGGGREGVALLQVHHLPRLRRGRRGVACEPMPTSVCTTQRTCKLTEPMRVTTKAPELTASRGCTGEASSGWKEMMLFARFW